MWYVGAGINLVGSICINLGTNIMKLGHNKRLALDCPEEEKPPIWKFRAWVIGMVLFAFGNIANFASFGFAAQSLLAALGSVQFVSNVFFAAFVLRERLGWAVIVGTGAIIGGCIVLVVFGNQESKDYTVHELIDFYKQPGYIVYLTMMAVFVFGSYILYLHGKSVTSKKGSENSVWHKALPLCYSIFSALLGTQSVLFSKSLSVLLVTTAQGDNQMKFWYTYVVFPCFIITAVFWVTRLNKGLRMFPAMIIVPLMQIFWTLFSIVEGMLYFKEYETFKALNYAMFSVGVLIVFIGVFMLTSHKVAPQGDEYEKVEGDGDQHEVYNNPAFENEDPDVPQKRGGGLDTLRFTSLAANTNIDIKTLRKVDSIRKARKETELNGTIISNGDGDFNSTLNASKRESNGMMGTMRRTLKNVNRDMGFDNKTAARLTFGFGDGNLPAISLFAMPAVDLVASKRIPSTGGLNSSLPKKSPAGILQELPQSRFYAQDDMEVGKHSQLEPITESMAERQGSMSTAPSVNTAGVAGLPDAAVVMSSTPPNPTVGGTSTAQAATSLAALAAALPQGRMTQHSIDGVDSPSGNSPKGQRPAVRSPAVDPALGEFRLGAQQLSVAPASQPAERAIVVLGAANSLQQPLLDQQPSDAPQPLPLATAVKPTTPRRGKHGRKGSKIPEALARAPAAVPAPESGTSPRTVGGVHSQAEGLPAGDDVSRSGSVIMHDSRGSTPRQQSFETYLRQQPPSPNLMHRPALDPTVPLPLHPNAPVNISPPQHPVQQNQSVSQHVLLPQLTPFASVVRSQQGAGYSSSSEPVINSPPLSSGRMPSPHLLAPGLRAGSPQQHSFASRASLSPAQSMQSLAPTLSPANSYTSLLNPRQAAAARVNGSTVLTSPIAQSPRYSPLVGPSPDSSPRTSLLPRPRDLGVSRSWDVWTGSQRSNILQPVSSSLASGPLRMPSPGRQPSQQQH